MKIYYPPTDLHGLVERLRAEVADLCEVLPVTRATLFGSWARGRATAFSDIDVLIVYDDPPRADAYSFTRRTLSQRGVEPHVYSESETVGLEATLARMTIDGVDLLDGARHPGGVEEPA